MKKNPADGRGKEGEVKQEWTDGYSVDEERRCCDKVCSHVDKCSPSTLGLETGEGEELKVAISTFSHYK